MFICRVIFILLFTFIAFNCCFNLFSSIFYATSFVFPYAIYPFDICQKAPVAWHHIKLLYVLTFLFSTVVILNSIFSFFYNKYHKKDVRKHLFKKKTKPKGLNLLIGKSEKTNELVYLPERSLYQNILITGTIGTGKTSSAMYPFAKQLIDYKNNSPYEKLGMLILDVKGNFYKQITEFCRESNRLDDLIVIEIGGEFTYNPLDKPELSATVLASRLKNILTLFSPETSESYWLDKAEQVLAEAIKICRLYNNGYVDFSELHRLINDETYFNSRIENIKIKFLNHEFSRCAMYNLYSALKFFQEEFKMLDSRVLSILKSEISRMTSTFISDYDVMRTFCPKKDDVNFTGFKEVLEKGKIVVLNMNISEYKNLSRIIAAYLKMDFQTEILMTLSSGKIRKSAFICDEYHEYVTETDSNFFAQSREAMSINIVATQSYSSLLNSIKNEAATKVIIQNLINKLWFRNDDLFTIETAQKQIGKEDKTRISKSFSENAQKTFYNYFTNSLNSKDSSISESISSFVNSDFVYDYNFFTRSLETFSCLSFLSNGDKIISPDKLKLFPYFQSKK